MTQCFKWLISSVSSVLKKRRYDKTCKFFFHKLRLNHTHLKMRQNFRRSGASNISEYRLAVKMSNTQLRNDKFAHLSLLLCIYKFKLVQIIAVAFTEPLAVLPVKLAFD